MPKYIHTQTDFDNDFICLDNFIKAIQSRYPKTKIVETPKVGEYGYGANCKLIISNPRFKCANIQTNGKIILDIETEINPNGITSPEHIGRTYSIHLTMLGKYAGSLRVQPYSPYKRPKGRRDKFWNSDTIAFWVSYNVDFNELLKFDFLTPYNDMVRIFKGNNFGYYDAQSKVNYMLRYDNKGLPYKSFQNFCNNKYKII